MMRSRTWARFSKQDATIDFERFYDETLPRVYNFFRYRVGDEQLAQDLTATTFAGASRAGIQPGPLCRFPISRE